MVVLLKALSPQINATQNEVIIVYTCWWIVKSEGALVAEISIRDEVTGLEIFLNTQDLPEDVHLPKGPLRA